jgi:hypothetical protein
VFLTMLFGGLAVLLLTVLAWPTSALVRRHYGVKYALAGQDAKAHRWIRIASLATLVAMGGLIGWMFAMMSNFDLMGPGSDGIVVALRILVTIALLLGTLVALWNAWHVVRARRSLWAKVWAVVLAAAFLGLLWVGFATHLIGFDAYY